jgi:flagellar biosynthesis component FlhA
VINFGGRIGGGGAEGRGRRKRRKKKEEEKEEKEEEEEEEEKEEEAVSPSKRISCIVCYSYAPLQFVSQFFWSGLDPRPQPQP